MSVRPMQWERQALQLLDQRLLPLQEKWLQLQTWQHVRDAIADMAVRGAPAIGIAAAYGMALAAQSGEDLAVAKAGLAASRPTAVNLFWALDRIAELPDQSFESVLREAKSIESEDMMANLEIGRHGSDLIQNGDGVLTICNTGGLATSGHGTALGIIRSASYDGKDLHVYSCETRPRLQGLRLTSWELLKESIPFQSIVDGAAGSLMRAGNIQIVLAGADRIAANGDTANKIGTYSLAVLARHHSIPFVIAAPESTIDRSIDSGEQIPIEERSSDEITSIDGNRVAPIGCPAYNPAFDVTPAELISAIVTEEGVYRPSFKFS